MQNRIKLKWESKENGSLFETMVPVKDGHRTGHIKIWATKRPSYCDRGQWLAHVDGLVDTYAPLDDQESWPRYYFSQSAIFSEIEAWVNKREQCIKAFEAAAKKEAKS